MQDSSFRFLNRSILFFSKEQTEVKPKEKKFIKIEAPFVDEISGLAIVKMLDNKGQCTVVLKLKLIRNCASLDVTNNTQETVIFDPNQMLGVLDLRSLGYYKIKQGVLQQNLSKCYHFESVVLCNPNFVSKNNQYFGLSSIYFLYPLISLPRMVNLEMPASIEQSKLFVLVTRCWSSFVFQDQ